jgi:hypothetical protein
LHVGQLFIKVFLLRKKAVSGHTVVAVGQSAGANIFIGELAVAATILRPAKLRPFSSG